VLQQSGKLSRDLSKRTDQCTTLELDDIQHFLMARPLALAARYEFLKFRSPAGGRAWLIGLTDKVGNAKAVGSSALDSRWVTIGFTWNGLRTLGVDEASLATFPEEFRQGMAARAEVLGTTGANHPKNWVGDLASPDLHAIAILFARDVVERERCQQEHERYVAKCEGVELLSSLDMEAIPPFDYAHEHFGYRDRLSQPVIEGMGVEPTPGSGPAIKAGEFLLGYPDEDGPAVGLPQPEILSRNGSYVAYLRMEEHVGAFRDFLREHGKTPEEQELVAAKLMGRWRSGAPLVLAPDKDEPSLGADSQRNNDFNYGGMDPYGYGCPLGAHIRRMNPRDTAVNMNRRKMIRRGGTYGPPLPEGAPEDAIERGIAAFVGCASLVRQFEFAMNVWANDPNFHELGNERDPIFGTQDGTFDMTIPKRPIRKKIKGLPAFTTIRGGAYFFLPGIKALRYLAFLSDDHSGKIFQQKLERQVSP
jgi:Dyp-type peroxidase family